jgi:hypothetical protein
MALPTLDAVFASAADLPRRMMLAQWLVNIQYSGSVADYATLPEYYLWAKIAVAAGAPKAESDYISLPKNYAWSDIYNAVSGHIAESTVVVSGLSDTSLNGRYFYDGDEDGRPSYSLNESTSIYWNTSDPSWLILKEGNITASYQDVAYPWLATEWNDEGIDPTGLVLTPETPNHTDWSEKQALGHIAAAYRGDTGNPANLATYIDWPWRYQVASIITNTAVDTDAQTFITTSGATDKEGIDQFVKGVKNLGLWNSMVCWPLRSAQNAGTGTTAYSLGGLGTLNGTLVNGPTWASNGLDFDGNNDRVTLPNGSFGTGNAATSIWAFLKNDTTTSRMIVLSQGDNNSGTDGFALQSQTGAGNDDANIAFTSGSIAAPSTAWKSLFIGNTSAGFWGKDGGTVTEFALSNVLNKTGNNCAIGAFGNPAGVAPFDGKIAAVIRINATPTTQLNGDIYTLYKNTIGAGLGLP